MAIANRRFEQAEPVQDNRYCAHGMCGEFGTIADTTHAGPETKWYCRDHFFKKQSGVSSIKKGDLKRLWDMVRIKGAF